ncbi:MAG TPA: hypothetical protein VHX65_14300 [Pirellulales bacterium]|jgi:hypothetical protein|nr:hypothetical protein [Pirellulales bacterium]
MPENIVMLRSRLRREGRLQDYLLRQVELRKQHPSSMVYVHLEEEFGPSSLRRLRVATWEKLLHRVHPDKRADQWGNFDWAKSHLNEKPDGIKPRDVPSRAAIELLLWALESPENRRRFWKLHRTSAAAEARRLKRAAEVEADNKAYWAASEAWHARELSEIRAGRDRTPDPARTVDDVEARRYLEEEGSNRGTSANNESGCPAAIETSMEAQNA